MAAAFYRDGLETAKATEVAKNRQRVGKLQSEIEHALAKRNEAQWSCREAATALEQAKPGDKDTIQGVFTRRQQQLFQLEKNLQTVQGERDALDRKVGDQEAYVFRSEPLDYLLSRRYAVNPRNLADALAGLPCMKWRQSFTRCSGMPFNEPRFPYLVFELISRVWQRRLGEVGQPPLDFFRVELLRLSKKTRFARQFLLANWRDLRLSIEECWKSEQASASIPYVLASIFLQSATRQKDAAEKILTESENLDG